MTSTFPTDDPTWDLEPIFEGGVESESFSREVERLKSEISDLEKELKSLQLDESVDDEARQRWRRFFDSYFELQNRIQEAQSFSRCLAAAHTDDPRAVRMPARLDDISTAFDGIRVQLQARFRRISDEIFETFVGDERFREMVLWLEELRRDADRSMEPELEALAVELNRDGLHAWGRLYSQMSGRLEVEVDTDGSGEQTFSVAQAMNLMESPRRQVRRSAFEGLSKAWEEIAPNCAAALHSIIGTRSTLYRRRGDDYLQEALDVNRIEGRTLETMLTAAREFQPLLVRYLKTKARALGLERLQWYDLRAPIAGDGSEEKISFEEAQKFIVEQAQRFSPAIADFCRHALANRWVEAEDRAGKRQGGYCTTLPVSKEIRIFMTFGGTSSGVTTLAHELGHGYHGYVMRDLPASQRRLPMGLAETASTFLEAVVEDAALRQASDEKRLALLDERLGRGVAFLMNIPARFRLEQQMYEHRAGQTLHEELLTEITTEIFEEAYGGGVASVDRLYWAAKLHFFLTRMPFYNFPYTFGYLFSRAVYRRALEEGPQFLERIDDMLRDTGRMRCEDLARKYLDVDLQDQKFWTAAAATLEQDLEQYEQLLGEQ